MTMEQAYGMMVQSDGGGGGGSGGVPVKPAFKRINTAPETIQSRKEVCGDVRTHILQWFISILRKDKENTDAAKAADGKQEDGGGGGGKNKKKKKKKKKKQIKTGFMYMTQDDLISCVKTMGEKIKRKADRLAQGPGPKVSWSKDWFKTNKKNFKCTEANGNVVTESSLIGLNWEELVCEKRQCCQIHSRCPEGVAIKKEPCEPPVYIKPASKKKKTRKAEWCLTKSEFLIGVEEAKGKEIDDVLINNIDGDRGLVAYFNHNDPYGLGHGAELERGADAEAAAAAEQPAAEN